MQRKLIKQGGYGFTIYLPKKWIDKQGLEAGDEINVEEEADSLILNSLAKPKKIKSTQIQVRSANVRVYRSLIGGLYRAGYDEIKVNFSDKKVVGELQKTVDTLYGFEIFEITTTSCIIKAVYTEENVEVVAHVRKILQIIQALQEIISEDMEKKDFSSEQEVMQFRNTILKHRDIIARVIVQKRMLDNSVFPYYLISQHLWNIGRNYQEMYSAIQKDYKISKDEIEYLEKTKDYFLRFFHNIDRQDFIEKHSEYRSLLDKGIDLIKAKKGSLIISYCSNILMLLQSCNSQYLLLKY